MSNPKKIYLSKIRLYTVLAVSFILGLLLILLLLGDPENRFIGLVATAFVVSLVIIYFLSGYVKLIEDGIIINSKFVRWEDIQKVEIERDMVLTTNRMEKHTISCRRDYFNRIVTHVKNGREDLFLAPFQHAFNDKQGGRRILLLYLVGLFTGLCILSFGFFIDSMQLFVFGCMLLGVMYLLEGFAKPLFCPSSALS